jgi:tripartite-type tricarboxylate transporter receptor subunit TctC
MLKKIIATTAAATLFGLFAGSVSAQEFPSKGPIKLIVGCAPGGAEWQTVRNS